MLILFIPLSSAADRATCNSPGECNCIPGYSGTRCQNDDDVCGHTSPCVNGNCTNAGPNDYTCSCQFGYTGTNCETEVDACDPSALSCKNGGTCTVSWKIVSNLL